MRWTVRELATALGGADISPPAGVAIDAAGAALVDGVSIDSRTTAPGELFVPIIAERDGHDFVGKAVDAGAGAYLRSTPEHEDQRITSLLVSDTGGALLALGRVARDALSSQVIGVTGSVGKTSVKDLIRSVCAVDRPTHANEASFNNELGVPLTLIGAPADTKVVVIEMGARNVGHIERLCGIARPPVGVVTSVAAVHTEIFGSIDQVAQAKGELAEAIPPEGTLVLNADDPKVAAMRERARTQRILTYSATKGDVRFRDVVLGEDLRPTFTLETPVGTAQVSLGVAGAHMAQNAAAAAAAGIAVGIPLEAIVTGLTAPSVSPLRMDVQKTNSGATVINDSYNANPTSMAAALDALAAIPASRRTAILGYMAELGRTAEDDHVAICRRAVDAGIEVIAVDTPMYGSFALHVPDIDSAVDALGDVGPTDAVLVKGSRVAALERVATVLFGDA